MKRNPLPNEHSARQTKPDKRRYKTYRRSDKNLPKGISVIYGIKKKEGLRGGKTEIQSFRFDKKLWSEQKAKAWLKKNGFLIGGFEKARKKNPCNIDLIDNDKGLGKTPLNQDVDYFGLKVCITPKQFLKLCPELEEPRSSLKNIIIPHLENGGKVGSPFLKIKLPDIWVPNKYYSEPSNIFIPVIVGHEGRHRMTAILKIFGNIPIECHLFFAHDVKRRHLNEFIINELNKEIYTEDGRLIKGPWFSL